MFFFLIYLFFSGGHLSKWRCAAGFAGLPPFETLPHRKQTQQLWVSPPKAAPRPPAHAAKLRAIKVQCSNTKSHVRRSLQYLWPTIYHSSYLCSGNMHKLVDCPVFWSCVCFDVPALFSDPWMNWTAKTTSKNFTRVFKSSIIWKLMQQTVLFRICF